MENTIPWVEKYRPTSFDTIVLDEINQTIIKNIIETDTFPNLLLYGPPGTGKTTTIINLIKSYQLKYKQTGKGLTIHLNASDERGIDIIRNQILQFVNSQSLFVKGMKFVVLDEVDYMTKNAQQALKYLLQEFSENVRFCLICNYISKIDESLRNELLQLRFNQLPTDKIVNFLENINNLEDLNLSATQLSSIQKLFNSDIRSMINYMQSNSFFSDEIKVIDDNVLNILHNSFLKQNKSGIYMIDMICREYNLDIQNIIKNYFSYVISKKGKYLKNDFICFAEYLIHIKNANDENLKNYFVIKMERFVCDS
jgi:DNA polymerase III delta prime subunit